MLVEDFMDASPILVEGRDAPLYHSTAIERAVNIVAANRINAHTRSGDGIAGVSLTRDKRFAQLWHQLDWPGDSKALFVLDQARMVRDGHKLVPERHEDSEKFGGDQAEEFHVGHLQNLDRYIIAIEITQEAYDDMLDNLERGFYKKGASIDEPGVAIIKKFLKNPKLKIVPGRDRSWRDKSVERSRRPAVKSPF